MCVKRARTVSHVQYSTVQYLSLFTLHFGINLVGGSTQLMQESDCTVQGVTVPHLAGDLACVSSMAFRESTWQTRRAATSTQGLTSSAPPPPPLQRQGMASLIEAVHEHIVSGKPNTTRQAVSPGTAGSEISYIADTVYPLTLSTELMDPNVSCLQTLSYSTPMTRGAASHSPCPACSRS